MPPRKVARWLWLERECTDRKVRDSNPTAEPRLPLPRLGQPGNIPPLMFPSGGMVVRHRKGATAERYHLGTCNWKAAQKLRGEDNDRRAWFEPNMAQQFLLSKLEQRESFLRIVQQLALNGHFRRTTDTFSIM
ncbi:hypothetical protein CSKR_108178 [Clonorchis sinensis]|uniref:ATP-binding cassette transporter n=1 Tax=Clonorchis sinensis TaxID=79923 RepID=A0A419PFQ0_CLOSI|nr:hypothetical protein CSKR_108178 [Clonorchis sinensis]